MSLAATSVPAMRVTRAAGRIAANVLPLPGSLSISSAAWWRKQHVLDDREAEASAAGRARAAAVDAIEALGEPRQVLGRDADAGVGDREAAAAVRSRSATTA